MFTQIFGTCSYHFHNFLNEAHPLVASWLHDEAKNMGGLQAGSDWDAYTDAQWESWNAWQLKNMLWWWCINWNVVYNKTWTGGHQLDTRKTTGWPCGPFLQMLKNHGTNMLQHISCFFATCWLCRMLLVVGFLHFDTPGRSWIGPEISPFLQGGSLPDISQGSNSTYKGY